MQPIGIVNLFETTGERDRDRPDVRLGYLRAEHVWGRGMDSELVSGVVEWARAHRRSQRLQAVWRTATRRLPAY
jgi:RimJ/RimL family protein N-acetyltransferase